MIMPDDRSTHGRGEPPASFIEQVREALHHLYDLGYLESHPLRGAENMTSGETRELVGQRLRRELASALEALGPGPGIAFGEPQARRYDLLRLRYVEDNTVLATAHELGLSLRQAHRDLRLAEESLATLLWARLAEQPAADSGNSTPSAIQQEMASLGLCPRPTDLGALLQEARKSVAREAAQRNVRILIEMPNDPIILWTDRTIAEQVFLNTLSYSLQQAQASQLSVTLKADAKQASLRLQYLLAADAAGSRVASLVVTQLMDRLGWTMTEQDRSGAVRVVTLNMPARSHTVLVIDDNEGLVELIERYLTDRPCQVVAAASGMDGLRLALELSPDAIILDVMMPQMHGWEVLQRLRAQPQTARIPVIICSVINNPDLAYSLGASLVITKPVSRDSLLAALGQFGVA